MLRAAIVSAQVDQTGNSRIHCPTCHPQRRNKYDRSLSVRLDGAAAVYHCWHCGLKGKLMLDNAAPTVRFQRTPQPPLQIPRQATLAQRHLQWLKDVRHIDAETAQHFGLYTDRQFIGGYERDVIALPYERDGTVYAAKYRATEDKLFIQQRGRGCETFWNLTSAAIYGAAAKRMIITEGEFDAMAAWQAGCKDVVSVPAGAPATMPQQHRFSPADDRRLHCIAEAADAFKTIQRFIVAVDADGPGEILGDELARRLGRAKCWRPVYPEGCKDLNDVLIRHGENAVRAAIDNATPWPVNGLYSASHYAEELASLYTNGTGRGELTGWGNVDELLTILPGQVAIVTGVPNSGKSEWLDALTVNLAMRRDWKIAICSFENPPQMHIAKLAEKFIRKPFFGADRMSQVDLDRARTWIDRHYSFIQHTDGRAATIESVLDKAAAAVQRTGCRLLVIDPYNYLDRDRDISETDYISDMLTKVRAFATAYECFVAFVAHPGKLGMTETGAVPTGYNVSGGAHWFNKADIGLTIDRKRDSDRVDVVVWKCRFKWVGRQGKATLVYDRSIGIYRELPFDLGGDL